MHLLTSVSPVTERRLQFMGNSWMHLGQVIVCRIVKTCCLLLCYYKNAVLVYQCLHGLVPAYLSVDLQSIKDLPPRQRLRSCFYVSRPDIEPVHCRWPRFPNCRCTSLAHSAAGRSVIYSVVLCQLSRVGSRLNFFHRAFLKMPHSHVIAWSDYVNFR